MRKNFPYIMLVLLLISSAAGASNRAFRPSALRHLGKDVKAYFNAVMEEDFTHASRWQKPERRLQYLLDTEGDKTISRVVEFEIVSLEKVDLRDTPTSTEDPLELPQDRAEAIVWVTFFHLPSNYVQKSLIKQHWVKLKGEWFIDGSEEVTEEKISGSFTDYGPDTLGVHFRNKRYPDLKP